MFAFWIAFARVYFPVIGYEWIVALTWSHIVPQVILLVNLRSSDVQLKIWHGFIGAVIATLYLVIDWYKIVVNGSPTTYEFLSWEGPDSMIKSAFFVIGSMLVYILVMRMNSRSPTR